MKKKFISLVLLAGLVLSTFAGCSGASDEESTSSSGKDLTATITLTAITGKSTTQDAIEQVQAAFNKLTKSEYKTQVIFQLKTEDEYVDFIESQVEAIEADIAAAEEAAAQAKAEAKAKKEAEKAAAANTKKRSKWTTTTKAETTEDTAETQAMTQDEYGREVAKYPELEGASLDIIFISGIEMFQDFVKKEYIQPLNDELANSSKILNKYIYPTILDAGKDGSSVYAIVNNRMMGEYTYLLVDKTLAKKYDLDASKVKSLTGLEEFLDSVKENEKDYVPLNEIPELNYLHYAGFEGSLLGQVIKPGYSTTTKALPKSLLAISDYVEYMALVDKLEAGKYAGKGDKYAVQVVHNAYITSPEDENWEENYDVVVYEKPTCSNNLMDGMFAVSTYASDISRCMEIVTMLNTNAEARNIYAYGIEGVNYVLNENGTVHMLNNDWSMNFYHTGNTFVGAVPENLPANYAEIGKLQNIETITGPYFKWVYENEETEALLKEFKPVSDKYMADFMKATDKIAFAEEIKEVIAEDETVKKMLDADNSNGLLGSYAEFHQATYPSKD
ncbi:MAG: hypothetical protein MJ175_08800 [Clostridia bacterium]|nr:hypothetical protein [Clostridia bacterium]